MLQVFALRFAVICTLALFAARAGILTGPSETPWNEKEGKLPTPTNRHECYEDCDYQWGKDTEKCNRLPKNKRPECHSKALARRSRCRHACDENYPE